MDLYMFNYNSNYMKCAEADDSEEFNELDQQGKVGLKCKVKENMWYFDYGWNAIFLLINSVALMVSF